MVRMLPDTPIATSRPWPVQLRASKPGLGCRAPHKPVLGAEEHWRHRGILLGVQVRLRSVADGDKLVPVVPENRIARTSTASPALEQRTKTEE